MSAVYFSTATSRASLRGSERAYANVLATDISMAAATRGVDVDKLTDTFRDLSVGTRPYRLEWAFSGIQNDVMFYFEGLTHHGEDLALNTLIATGSPALSLLARIHGQCEIHCHVAEENRQWLAGVIREGRATNVLRPNQGWDNVVALLEEVEKHPGPVVTSYSVTDGFPYPSGEWAGRKEWWELPPQEQWDMAYSDLIAQPGGLEITPENLTRQGFGRGMSVWDVLQSPEYAEAWRKRNL